MTSINTLFHKAYGLLRLGSQGEISEPSVPPPEFAPTPITSSPRRHSSQSVRLGACRPSSFMEQGDVVFCKNNVCVHPPVPLRAETVQHHPGYLCIRTREDELLGNTLVLTWIPNATLKINPRSLEKRTPGSSPCRSNRSSACPSPTYHGGNSNQGSNAYLSNCPSPQRTQRPTSLTAQQGNDAASELSFGDADRRSISSTMSDLGSPRDDLHSLDSWTTVEADAPETSTPGSADSHDISIDILGPSDESSFQSERHNSVPTQEMSLKEKLVVGLNNKSQTDSGIGPEEVSAALESMISGLNEMDVKNDSANHETDDELTIVKGDSSPENSSCTTKREPRENNCDRESKRWSNCSEIENITANAQTENSSSTTPTTSNRDPQSYPESMEGSPSASPHHSSSLGHLKFLYAEGTPESLAHAHNLSFPDTHNSRRASYLIGSSYNAYSAINSLSLEGSRSPGRVSSAASSICNSGHHRESSCGFFSVDLSQMRSLRLFFCDKEQTCGQLVVASRESQYKILHFHNGGLDRLAQVFQEWNHLLSGNASHQEEKNQFNLKASVSLRRKNPKNKDEGCCPYRQFWVFRPEVTEAECHPEEGIFLPIDDATWRDYFNQQGQIEDEHHFRKNVFFAGLSSHLRSEIWPFLVQHYAFQTTYEEREQIRHDSYLEYQTIKRKKEQMCPKEFEHFWKNVQCTVEKDVIRTDRGNPFFAGDDNPNIKLMENILLCYAIYNPSIGYTQGMSDLLAPVLAEVKDEAETFWCFVGLMQKTIFFSSPKDTDMDVNLSYLLELLRLMTPDFYSYLCSIRDGLELLFAHRWVLLCFKREFPEPEALRLWEACWAHYQTDYFHLFVCVAIVAVYGEDVTQQGLRSDEILLHFSSLAMHMDGEVVLRKARGLLHQFRTLPSVPCTLSDLCQLCGPGMWDSGHVPLVECSGHHLEGGCPKGGQERTLKD